MDLTEFLSVSDVYDNSALTLLSDLDTLLDPVIVLGFKVESNVILLIALLLLMNVDGLAALPLVSSNGELLTMLLLMFKVGLMVAGLISLFKLTLDSDANGLLKLSLLANLYRLLEAV